MDNKLLPLLSQNLLEILNEEKYCDIDVEVGTEPYTRTFRSHMVILHYRSPYLRRILSTKKNDDDTFTNIKLPNILPKTFIPILRYIYGGKLSFEEYDTSDIVKILVAASELCLQQLVVHLQHFLIKNKARWLDQHFDLVFQISSENDSFLELQKYSNNLISKEPDKILESLDLSSISEELLISIIQSDNIQMSEIQIWESILTWGLAQKPKLPSDLGDYSKEDFNTLKNRLEQCISFIGFYNLNSKEFYEKVLPYKKILPKDLRKDLLKYFLNPNNKKGNDDESFDSIKNSAEKGNLEAQFKLGYYYDKGIGIDIDKSKAFELYNVAAERGSDDAQYSLGLLYQFGEGVNKDEGKAFELMKDLAEKDYVNAQFQLGYYYDEGIGTKMDKFKAFKLYEIAAKSGDNEAQYNLSLLYQLGEGTHKDENKAFELIKDLVEKDYLNAQVQLGYYYLNGIGTHMNKSKAFELYKVAAEKGNNNAQYNLGLLYQSGEGVNKDEEKAFELINDLAEKGDSDAQCQLGDYYLNGIGIKANYEKAIKSYTIAAEKGHKTAQNNLGSLYKKRSDYIRASYWFDKAAENEDEIGQDNLGEIDGELGVGDQVYTKVQNKPIVKTVKPPNKLFVGNLPFSIDNNGLKSIFKDYNVTSARVVYFNDGRSKGYGFVELADEEEIIKALEGLKSVRSKGRPLNIDRIERKVSISSNNKKRNY